MKFSVSSSALLSLLATTGKVISNKNTLPILDYFLMELNGNELKVTTSDLETTLIGSITVDSVESEGTIDEETAIAARKWMDIDELGLDELDRSLLRAIIEMYNGGPVGLETLAAALGEESVTLEDICEPYLMQMGMLTRTPRGRCVTRLAYEHLHMAVPKRFDDEDSGQTSMF